MDTGISLARQYGARIRLARQAVGLSSADLAALIGVRHQSVKRWECGVRIPPHMTMREIAQACNTTVSYILGEEGYDEPFRRFTGAIPLR
jgi:transcriptional regulator with XRE-family HTH domain